MRGSTEGDHSRVSQIVYYHAIHLYNVSAALDMIEVFCATSCHLRDT